MIFIRLWLGPPTQKEFRALAVSSPSPKCVNTKIPCRVHARGGSLEDEQPQNSQIAETWSVTDSQGPVIAGLLSGRKVVQRASVIDLRTESPCPERLEVLVIGMETRWAESLHCDGRPQKITPHGVSKDGVKLRKKFGRAVERKVSNEGANDTMIHTAMRIERAEGESIIHQYKI